MQIWWKQTDCRRLEMSEGKSWPRTFANRLFLRKEERKLEILKIGVAFWHILELGKFSADVWPKLLSIISLGWAWCLVPCRALKWNREMKWRRSWKMSWQFWQRGEFQQGRRVSREDQLGQLFRPPTLHERDELQKWLPPKMIFWGWKILDKFWMQDGSWLREPKCWSDETKNFFRKFVFPSRM